MKFEHSQFTVTITRDDYTFTLTNWESTQDTVVAEVYDYFCLTPCDDDVVTVSYNGVLMIEREQLHIIARLNNAVAVMHKDKYRYDVWEIVNEYGNICSVYPEKGQYRLRTHGALRLA